MNSREASTLVLTRGQQTLARISTLSRALARELAGDRPSFADLEVLTLAISRESDRCTLEAELQQIADSFGEGIAVNGTTYARHETGQVGYHSLCGTLRVARATYRETGVRNGPTVVPLDLSAGLIERGTPAMAKTIALGYAKHELRGVVEDLEAAHRACPSRATMERMAKQIAAEAHAAAPVVERAVRLQESLPEGAHGVVIGLDRGSVPMAEERAPDQAPATPRRVRSVPYLRAVPTPIDVNWRMAPVVTISIVDAAGDGLVTRKYAAPASAGWEGLMKRSMADVAAALRECPTLRVAVVQDGAHELWSTVRAALATVPAVNDPLEAVDRFHLNERLGKVLRLVEKDPVARAQRQTQWNKLLDTRPDAADTIEQEIIQAGPRLDADGDDALHEHRVYLANNKDRMRYTDLRNAGLPIGSGPTESGCNTMLNLRVKRNAEHWSVEGLEGVLTLRGVHESERFDLFWKYFTRRYQSVVVPLAIAS